MKTLEEMADEYLAAAEDLKKKINELKQRDPGTNPAAIHRTIDIYEDMYSDAMISYHKLKNYYNK
jgi:DNA-binding SARP family transcriptional activator